MRFRREEKKSNSSVIRILFAFMIIVLFDVLVLKTFFTFHLRKKEITGRITLNSEWNRIREAIQ